MFFYFVSQNIFIWCLFQESDKMQYSWTFQKPPNLTWYFMQTFDVTTSNTRTKPDI